MSYVQHYTADQYAAFRAIDSSLPPYVPPPPQKPSVWSVVASSAIKAATPILWVPPAIVNAFKKPGGGPAYEEFNRTGDSWASLILTGQTAPWGADQTPKGWADLPGAIGGGIHDVSTTVYQPVAQLPARIINDLTRNVKPFGIDAKHLIIGGAALAGLFLLKG